MRLKNNKNCLSACLDRISETISEREHNAALRHAPSCLKTERERNVVLRHDEREHNAVLRHVLFESQN